MKLDEFISESLQQLIAGVTVAQEKAKIAGGIINPRGVGDYSGSRTQPILMYRGIMVQNVEFDIAVSVSDKRGGEAGAGIFVGPVSIGGKGSKESENQSTNRLRFTVPVTLPVLEESEEQDSDEGCHARE